MKKVLLFLKRPEVIHLITIMCLLVIIWIALPLIGDLGFINFQDSQTKLILTTLTVLGWGLFQFVQARKNQIKNEKIIAEVGLRNFSDLEEANQAEEESIKNKMDEVLNILKKKKFSKNQSLYELPWYVMIGPPGAGKTSAILNSNLNFPLKDHTGFEKINGIGGTRHCEWWFTDRAVLIDTAGRFTTQESHKEVDSHGWKSFLNQLKTNRPKRPLNGLIISFSLEDLFLFSDSEIKQNAKAIRDRIEEIQEQFQLVLPVYLVFTKADKIKGFREYFENTSDKELEKVFGFTYDLKKSNQDEFYIQFSRFYQELLLSLDSKLSEKLHYEQQIEKKKSIYEFPEQMRQMHERMYALIKMAFSDSSYYSPVNLRGTFFCSAVQTGAPFDRIASKMKQSIQADLSFLGEAQDAGYKGMFLKSLFTDVIFKESDLVGMSSKLRQNLVYLYTSGYLAVIIAGCLLGLGWITSYSKNSIYLNEVSEQITEFLPGNSTKPLELNLAPSEVSDRLLKLKNIGYAGLEYGEHPLSMGLGLSQINKIATSSDTAYTRGIEKYFIPYLKEKLEFSIKKGMSENDEQGHKAVYLTLPVYLMLTSHPQYFDSAKIEAWFESLWGKESYDQKKLSSLMENLGFVLQEKLSFGEPDISLVSQSRRYLLNIAPANLLYMSLTDAFEKESREHAFIPNRAAGEQIDKIFERYSNKPLTHGFSGLFTNKGYYVVFKPGLGKMADGYKNSSWMLGDEKDLEDQPKIDVKKLESEINRRYFDDYTSYWSGFLSDLSVKDFQSTGDAIKKIEIMTSPESPFVKLVKSIKDNTTLTVALGVSLSNLTDGKIETEMPFELKNKMTGWEVEKHFYDFNKIVGTEKSPKDLEKTIEVLKDIKGLLEAIEFTDDKSESSYNELKKISDSGAKSPLGMLTILAGKSPSPMKEWLLTIKSSTEGLLSQGAMEYVNNAWKDKPLSFCRASIAGKYPFVKNSNEDVALGDLGEFLSEGGVLDSFFKDYLAPFVTTRGGWKSKGLILSQETLRYFELTEKMRLAFFDQRSKQLGVKFKLTPRDLDSKSQKVFVSVGEKSFVYAHGRPIPYDMAWSSSEGEGSRLEFVSLGTEQTSELFFEGPWALFRMLDQAAVSSSSRGVKGLIKGKEFGRLEFDIAVSQTDHPWKNGNFYRSFDCKETL